MDEVALLPVGPWVLAAVATVLVVALSVPPGGPRPADLEAGPGPLARRWVAAVVAAVAVLLVVAARLGPDSELRNPVPVLVVGLGWPLLLLTAGVLGVLRPAAASRPSSDVRPAVVAALGLGAALAVPVAPTRPDAVALGVAAYALLVVAAAIAFGRAVVAARFEVLGLLARWLAVGRSLPRWAAPRGATAVLVVVLGASWFERYERTAAWTDDLPERGDAVLGLGAGLVLAAAVGGLLHLAVRRRSEPGTAAAVMLPLAAFVVLACVTRRALISGQLLVDMAFGPRPVDPDPLGLVGGQLLALGLVVLGGGLAGAVLARRTGEGSARLPGVAVLLSLTALSAWLVLQP